MFKKKPKPSFEGLPPRRTEEEILSENNARLIVPGLEGPVIIFDKAEFGRRVLASIEMFGCETVSLKQQHPTGEQPDQSS
jgi:hypothetical protein